MKKCRHYWQYVHAVYSGSALRDDLLVRRFCAHCNITQVGVVTRWRPERKNEFYQTAQQEAAKGDVK